MHFCGQDIYYVMENCWNPWSNFGTNHVAMNNLNIIKSLFKEFKLNHASEPFTSYQILKCHIILLHQMLYVFSRHPIVVGHQPQLMASEMMDFSVNLLDLLILPIMNIPLIVNQYITQKDPIPENLSFIHIEKNHIWVMIQIRPHKKLKAWVISSKIALEVHFTTRSMI